MKSFAAKLFMSIFGQFDILMIEAAQKYIIENK